MGIVLKPIVVKRKDVRGRIVAHVARIGEVTAEGATPKGAADQCECGVVKALDRLSRRTLVGAWRGHTYVVSPTTDGWEYWIDTFAHDGYSVQCGTDDREDAQGRAVAHLAQQVWTLDVAIDDEFVVGLPSDVAKETLRWIRFQRSYAALRAQGKSDNEAHRLAAG